MIAAKFVFPPLGSCLTIKETQEKLFYADPDHNLRNYKNITIAAQNTMPASLLSCINSTAILWCFYQLMYAIMPQIVVRIQVK